MRSRFPTVVKEVRGWGLINGIELTDSSGVCVCVKIYKILISYSTCVTKGVTAADVTKLLMENGVLVVPAGPKVIRFVPPLIVSEAEIDAAMKKFEMALAKLVAARK